MQLAQVTRGSSIHVGCLKIYMKQPSVTIEWLVDLVWTTRESTVAFSPEWGMEWKWCLFSFGLNGGDETTASTQLRERSSQTKLHYDVVFATYTTLTYNNANYPLATKQEMWSRCVMFVSPLMLKSNPVCSLLSGWGKMIHSDKIRILIIIFIGTYLVHLVKFGRTIAYLDRRRKATTAHYSAVGA